MLLWRSRRGSKQRRVLLGRLVQAFVVRIEHSINNGRTSCFARKRCSRAKIVENDIVSLTEMQRGCKRGQPMYALIFEWDSCIFTYIRSEIIRIIKSE